MADTIDADQGLAQSHQDDAVTKNTNKKKLLEAAIANVVEEDEKLRALKYQTAALAALTLDSSNLALIFARKVWSSLETVAPYFLFPFSAIIGVVQAGLRIRQAMLDKTTSSKVIAGVEVVSAIAMTTAVVGSAFLSAAFALATPLIFTVTSAARTLFSAGSAFYYWGKSVTTAEPDKKQKYKQMAKANAVGALVGAALTVAVGFVMLAFKPLWAVILGIGGSVFGGCFAAHAAYKTYSATAPLKTARYAKVPDCEPETPKNAVLEHPQPSLSPGQAKIPAQITPSNRGLPYPPPRQSVPPKAVTPPIVEESDADSSQLVGDSDANISQVENNASTAILPSPFVSPIQCNPNNKHKLTHSPNMSSSSSCSTTLSPVRRLDFNHSEVKSRLSSGSDRSTYTTPGRNRVYTRSPNMGAAESRCRIVGKDLSPSPYFRPGDRVRIVHLAGDETASPGYSPAMFRNTANTDNRVPIVDSSFNSRLDSGLGDTTLADTSTLNTSGYRRASI
jgi:hypothetical protein